jgi:hypothetical protein
LAIAASVAGIFINGGVKLVRGSYQELLSRVLSLEDKLVSSLEDKLGRNIENIKDYLNSKLSKEKKE